MKHLSKLLLVLLAIINLAHAAYADPCLPPSNKKRFLRVERDTKGTPTALSTAILTYRPANAGDYSVDLVAALHVGEDEYYKELNRQFESYDALLYELISPPGRDLGKMKEECSGNPLSFLQRGFKDLLGLEFQLDGINYTKPNFVHADMSPEQFADRMEERGESFLGIFLKMFLKSAELQKKNPQMSAEVALMQMLLDPNQKVSLRTMVAQQFEDLDMITEVIDGEEGSTLISERNKVAIDVLKQELVKGKKRLGIFYGAGHMPDMEKRLINGLGLECKEQKWVTAWKLNS